jgi:hypothetical protein
MVWSINAAGFQAWLHHLAAWQTPLGMNSGQPVMKACAHARYAIRSGGTDLARMTLG